MKLAVLPNILTILRLALVPLFLTFTVIYPHHSYLPPIIFALASITDWLDGFIAKNYNLTSRFGTFLDPIADKILVISALLVLILVSPSLTLFICSVIIISREIIVTALREWMAIIGQQTKVNVQNLGRIKAAFQMLGITICLVANIYNSILINQIGISLLVLSVILTLASMYIYLAVSWRHLTYKETTS